MAQYDTVILAGGRGSRLSAHGGRTDKAALALNEEPLISSALRAARSGSDCVVVGSTNAPLPEGVRLIADQAPDAGPAYSLRTGLGELTGQREWVLVLSCDIPGADKGIEHLYSVLPSTPDEADGVIAVDHEGRQQWLMGFYRSAALRASFACVRPHDSLRASMNALRLIEVPLPETVTRDVDTREDLQWWQANRR